jgi:hypothetical protein
MANENVKVPGVELNLGGTIYTVPPLSLGTLEKLQKESKDFTASTASVTTVIDATTAALKRNYPEMTRDAVAELIDLSMMADVMGAVMDVSGIKRQAQEASK